MPVIFWIIIVVLLIFCAVIPLLNITALIIGFLSPIKLFLGPNTTWMTQLGQMGDFFGGHTAAFSGLLSAALIVYFSLQQLKIAKQTADLTSISKIYDHYGENYGKDRQGQGEILSRVARGHRSWAIRESFSIIDPDGALEEVRTEQVDEAFDRLVKLCGMPPSLHNYGEIAELCGSLLLDKRLAKNKRVALWKMYELLRKEAAALDNPSSEGSLALGTVISSLHTRFLHGSSW